MASLLLFLCQLWFHPRLYSGLHSTSFHDENFDFNCKRVYTPNLKLSTGFRDLSVSETKFKSCLPSYNVCFYLKKIDLFVLLILAFKLQCGGKIILKTCQKVKYIYLILSDLGMGFWEEITSFQRLETLKQASSILKRTYLETIPISLENSH